VSRQAGVRDSERDFIALRAGIPHPPTRNKKYSNTLHPNAYRPMPGLFMPAIREYPDTVRTGVGHGFPGLPDALLEHRKSG